ncbi:hypothetical protein Malapachy_3844 [Malassezia pachydermatis]|uniref:Small ribosomal subunit protein mS41 n=1 Tax=Malassezia pachydermatis TaxID=77020 RepID=A0A0M8MLD9_9BASI|nr:hypothetical protein Malapachy_3844 [Malassezia pachydermatis]KOS13908.1 hypothetical protein Malapachy_3844 [Malassezia pachydermatis]
MSTWSLTQMMRMQAPWRPVFARFLSSAQNRTVPPPRGSIDTPKAFLKAISRTRRDLVSNSTCVSAVGEDWNEMFSLTTEKLKGAGVPVKERKYILWSLEKYRQGLHPSEFAYDIKKPKKVRGWGPRVQKGYRVRGELRPGEKRA